MKSLLLIISFIWSFLAPLPPGIAINPETKECGDYYGGDEYGAYVLPPPWEVTYNPTINTGKGTIRWEGSTEEYCRQIGYTFVPGELGHIYGQEQKSFYYYTLLMCNIAPFVFIIAVIVIGCSLYSKRKKGRINDC
jgi:hypothetical protein